LSGSAEYAYFPGEKVTVDCQGRSGGWLVVLGLPPVEEWDAVMVSRWNKFQNDVRNDVDYQMGKEAMLEAIEANEWWKDGASQYNYIDTDKGTLCLADVRAEVEKFIQEKFGLTLEEVCS
jgi:hypothetical protein